MIKSLFLKMHIACAFAIIGIASSPVQADQVFTGFRASASSAVTTDFSPSVTTGPANNSFSAGGEGFTSPISYATDFGAEGEISNFSAPVLRGRTTGFANEGIFNFVGLMSTFQYDGPGPGTVNYNWALDAVLTEPDDTAAFIRYNGAIVTNADFFSTSFSDFFESAGTVEDSFTFTQGDAGTIDESGTISFDANPGDVFYLVTGLQTYSGRAGAITDAFSTGTGTFSVTGGGSITQLTAVPEPTAASILSLLGIVGIAVRRRKR